LIVLERSYRKKKSGPKTMLKKELRATNIPEESLDLQ